MQKYQVLKAKDLTLHNQKEPIRIFASVIKYFVVNWFWYLLRKMQASKETSKYMRAHLWHDWESKPLQSNSKNSRSNKHQGRTESQFWLRIILFPFSLHSGFLPMVLNILMENKDASSYTRGYPLCYWRASTASKTSSYYNQNSSLLHCTQSPR